MFLVVHHICNEHLRLHVQPQLPPPCSVLDPVARCIEVLRFRAKTVVASTHLNDQMALISGCSSECKYVSYRVLNKYI